MGAKDGEAPPSFLIFPTFKDVPLARTSGELLRVVVNRFDCPNFKWLEGKIATLGGKKFFVEKVTPTFPVPPSGTRVGEEISLLGIFLE